jgi:uncharacterized LabA/DUF88 family protein
MPDPSPLLAVLIDADNAPAKYAHVLFEEIAAIGEASVRRIYGDFSKQNMNGWAEVQGELGLVPHHQPAYTKGKNSSDIALVIDAMDLMHSGRFNGFVLVSSDSDFTRLASRLREQGLDVYGMGEQKTPESFRNVCKRFIILENLLDTLKETATQPAGSKKPEVKKPAEARELILRAMESIEQDDEWYGMGVIGQRLIAAKPDFDTRTYGKRRLGDLVDALDGFETRRDKNNQLQMRRVK